MTQAQFMRAVAEYFLDDLDHSVYSGAVRMREAAREFIASPAQVSAVDDCAQCRRLAEQIIDLKRSQQPVPMPPGVFDLLQSLRIHALAAISDKDSTEFQKEAALQLANEVVAVLARFSPTPDPKQG